MPCQWKGVRYIAATQLLQVGFGGIGLADEDQRVHITIHDPVMEAPNCPTNYLWISTGEARIRVVQKVEAAASKEEDFSTLQPSEILSPASINLKLE